MENLKPGLTKDKALTLLKEYGLNEIKEKKKADPWKIFLGQFKSPLVLILIAACIISLLLRESAEALAIGSILFLNAFIGFFQEYRAEKAIAALRGMTAPHAQVIRDGTVIDIFAKFIVPGDLLVLQAGDIVAADGILKEVARLQINEAVLTGESFPAEKQLITSSSDDPRKNKVFMGTSVIAGTGLVFVTKTGMTTELGTIANLISEAESGPTPLQLQLKRLGKHLLLLCLTVVGVIALIGFAQNRPVSELLIFALSLAVAAVPEGMPAIVTVALALGVQKLAKQKALIRSLPSVETLGSVSVICTDKTGTLTTGNMKVRELWGENIQALLYAGASCCDSVLDDKSLKGLGDPTEIAILQKALEQNIDKNRIEKENPRILVEPFDPQRRYMSILRADGMYYVKGAAEVLISHTQLGLEDLTRAQNAALNFSRKGLRVIAVGLCKTSELEHLKLLGFIGIADPPRPEAKKAIEEARGAGIIPIMITGDHPETAKAIALELGLVLEHEPIEDRIHARATPAEKLKLVRQWKDRGQVVAMTGDGVNDAPALREAHIGIAMGLSGTEVTRQAADLILADDNFATIVAAVKEGRNIFYNIRQALTYLLMGNFGELLVVAGAVAWNLPLPLLAAHLLWINLVTDALPALTLLAEPISHDIMKKCPRPLEEELIEKKEWYLIVAIGLLEAGIALVCYNSLLKNFSSPEARGMIFTGLIFSQIFRSLSARSTTQCFWEIGIFRNPWLIGVGITTLVIQLSLHFIPFTQFFFDIKPLTAKSFVLLFGLSLISTFILEMQKLLNRHFRRLTLAPQRERFRSKKPMI